MTRQRLPDPLAEARAQEEERRAAARERARQALAAGVVACTAPTALDPDPPEWTPPADGAWTGTEAQFQAQAEQYLHSKGFWPRTGKHVFAPARGRYLHLDYAQGNPHVLDLLLTDHATGLCCEIELKTARGRLSEQQRALLAESPHRHIAYGMAAFVAIVDAYLERCERAITTERARR